MMKKFDDECNKIVQRYNFRAKKDKANYYNIATPSCRISACEKNEYFIRILYENFGYDFVDKKYLEVGCGTGTNLANFISWGICPENLSGNDVFEPSICCARQRLPQSVKLQHGNFLDCLYDCKSFDVILFSTVLSSILDEKFQIECLNRSYDLLKKDGIVLLYDFKYDNPWNRDVRGIKLKKITIPQTRWSCSKFNNITLCPPLARKLEKLPFLIKALTFLKVFNTHIVGFLKK